jgi:hypothetical protein
MKQLQAQDSASKLEAQLVTLRGSLELLGSNFTAAVEKVDRLHHCLLLYRNRTSDPTALPELMMELGVIDEEADSVISEVNRLFILKKTRNRREEEQIGVPEG